MPTPEKQHARHAKRSGSSNSLQGDATPASLVIDQQLDIDRNDISGRSTHLNVTGEVSCHVSLGGVEKSPADSAEKRSKILLTGDGHDELARIALRTVERLRNIRKEAERRLAEAV